MIRDDTTVRPIEATAEDLMVVHTKGYLDSLKVKIEMVPPFGLIFFHEYLIEGPISLRFYNHSRLPHMCSRCEYRVNDGISK